MPLVILYGANYEDTLFQVINDLLDPAGQNLRVREDAQVNCTLQETSNALGICVVFTGPFTLFSVGWCRSHVIIFFWKTLYYWWKSGMEVENLMKVIAVTVNSPYPSFEHLRKIYEWDMK
jgi:hypothetical protein